MKRFLVLSAIVGLAGIGVGVAKQGGQPATVAATAIETTTSTTLAPPPTSATPTSSTTAQKVAAKPTAIKVTTTTTRPVALPAPVTVATAPPTTTTTTIVAAPQQITPMCSTSATPAAAGSYVGGGTWGDARISSNMPKTRTRLTVQYPALKQQFWLTTDASGAAKKIFELKDSGTTSLSVDFYDAAENHVGGSPACQTTFMSSEA